MSRAMQVEEEAEYWNLLGNFFGWKLYAWTYKNVADFTLPSKQLFTVTKEVRDQIVEALGLYAVHQD